MIKEEFYYVNGVNIFVKMMGNGEPLVFLHGGPGGEHRFFLPHVEELAKHFTLVFYDQRGCGKSEKLENVDDYTMQGEVETLEELRKHLGFSKLNLIGESWGSMLALLYSTCYPTNVNKMVLTAAVGATSQGFSVFGQELENRLSEEDKASFQIVVKKLQTGEASVKDIFAILNPYYVYSVDSLSRKTETTSNAEVNGVMGKDIQQNYDVREDLDKISHIPIRILQGEHDLITPAKLDELLLQYIPHAELVILEKCGHWTVVEAPERFNQEVSKFFSN